VIGRIRDFELLLISSFIYLAESKFGEAMLITNSIETDATHLYPDGTLARASGVDLLEETLLYYKFFH